VIEQITRACILAILSAAVAYGGDLNIIGNRALSDSEIKRIVDSQTSTDSADVYIRKDYADKGYFNIEIAHSYRSDGSETIRIEEGNPAFIRRLAIDLASENPGAFSDLESDASGLIASKATLDNIAAIAIRRLAEKGMPFAKAEWTGFNYTSPDSLDLHLKILAGEEYHVSAIDFDGRSRTKYSVLAREAGIEPGDIYSESKINTAQRRIDRMPYLDIVSPFQLELGRGDSCRVVYFIKEEPSSRFDGAGGFNGIGGKNQFIGHIDMEFGDILGTGRAFGLRINKKDKYSSELRVNYFEPYLFGSILSAKITVSQLDRDTLFIETGGAVSLGYTVGERLESRLELGIRRVESETNAALSSSDRRNVKLDLAFDGTDYSLNPSGGYRIGSEIDYRFRSNRRVIAGDTPPTRLTAIGFEGNTYHAMTGRLVGALGIKSWGIVNTDGTVPVDEMRFIGGFDILRGYPEQFFPAYRYGIATVELRLLTGRKSRVYAFSDVGAVNNRQYAKNKYDSKIGYGLGLYSPTSLGQFKIEAAWNKDNFPSDAVLNFGVTGAF